MQVKKKALALLLSLIMIVSLFGGMFTVSAADAVNITPNATYGGAALTMTATGVDDKITVFDLASIGFGSGIEYAFWFDADGTFSFNQDVTVNYQGQPKAQLKAGDVSPITDFSECYLTLDDGNMIALVDKSNPGNFGGLPADKAYSEFPGTIAAASAPVLEPESSDDAASFVQAESFEAGNDYLIVAKSGDAYYALTLNEKAFSATSATVDGNVAAVPAEGAVNLLWTYNEKGELQNGTRFIYFAEGRVTAGGGQAVSYANGHFSAGSYYLTFGSGEFAISANEGEAAEILLFTNASANAIGKQANAFANGKYYIVAKTADGYKALGVSNKLFTASDAVVDGELLLDLADETVLWTYADGILTHDATGRFFYLAADRVTAGGGQEVTYANGHLGGGSFFVSYSNGAFVASDNEAEAADILIFEQFTTAAKYTITFNPNADGLNVQSGTKIEGEPYKISETLVRSGYSLDGWNTKADGTGTTYAVGDEITTEGDLELFAVWSATELATYTRTDKLIPHNEYVVTAQYEGKYYALTYDGSKISATEVTVVGDTVTNNVTEMRWLLSEDNEFESVAFTGTFYYPYSGGTTYSSGRKFVYEDEILHFTTSSGEIGYVLFTDTGFGYLAPEEGVPENVAKIALFTRNIGYVEPPQPALEDFVGPDAVERKAVKNADGSIVLAFTSDIHNDGVNLNIKTWLEAAEADVGYIDAFGSCGDMGSAYAKTAADYWSMVQNVFDYFDSEKAAGDIGDIIYATGNHEWYPTAGGNYNVEYFSGNYPATQRFTIVGPGIVTDDYIIYCFGAGESAKKHSDYRYLQSEIDVFADWLKTAPTDIPIFVLTHYPLHKWESRMQSNAAEIIDMFNEHNNLIVLWGHNHSNYDDNYYLPLFPGDEMLIADGVTKKINFTYMAAGATADIEYTGPEAGSAACMNKGLVVTINADGELDYKYYTIDGEVMPIESPWLVRFRGGFGNYEVFNTQYVEDGKTPTAVEAPALDGYDFTGWYTWKNDAEVPFSFSEPITQNTLVTAKYAKELKTAAAPDEADCVFAEPDATFKGETLTMTAAGVGDLITVFDLSSLGYGNSIMYGFWFEPGGVVSFDQDVTLYYQGNATDYALKAGEFYSTEGFGEHYIQLDDGNDLLLLEYENPGNYKSYPGTEPYSAFPGFIYNASAVYDKNEASEDHKDLVMAGLEPDFKLQSITCDEEALASDVFSVGKDTIVIRMSFLDTLENGDHMVDVVYSVSDDTEVVMLKLTVKDSGGETTPDTYTITFESCAEDVEGLTGIKYEGTPYEITETLTRRRYKFLGWNTAADGSGEAYAVGDYITEDADLTLYAQWEKKTSGGGSSSSSSSSSSSTYKITVEDTEHGTLTASRKTADKNDKVTVTAKADKGWVLSSIKVTDKNGSKVELTDAGNDQWTFKMPASNVTVTGSFKRLNPYVDVKESDYFFDAVIWAHYAEPQITNGMDETHFEPNTTATRAHIVTFLWRACGCQEPTITENPFEDITESDYFYKAVLWAYEKGIVKGTDATHFTPKQTCSTAHIVTMLYRALGAGTDGWYEEAGEWAENLGLLKDMNLTVGTDVDCPRCAIVTFLYRALAK